MPDIGKPYGNFGRYSADLCLFLLVAKHGQFSRAAKKAGISQPRLSQRMHFLEQSLGRALFIRERRGVTLTSAGRELRDAVSDPLTGAADAFERFQDRPRRDQVVIVSDIAFASFLFLPEFASLSTEFKDLNISLLTVQMPNARNAPDADLFVRMEVDHVPAEHEVCLFKERVSAVCSPAYKVAHGGMDRPEDLRDKTLIDLSAKDDAPWYTWSSWFRELGATRAAAHDYIAFNSYDHVIRSATSGLGIALGWEDLIDIDSPTSGLVRAIPSRLESNRGYFLKILPGRANTATLPVFHWLTNRFARASG